VRVQPGGERLEARGDTGGRHLEELERTRLDGARVVGDTRYSTVVRSSLGAGDDRVGERLECHDPDLVGIGHDFLP
jgi:hypothetical protein